MRSFAPFVLLAVFVFGSVEGMSWLVGRYLTEKRVFYVPEPVDGYEAYMARRDPVMGWPPSDEFGGGSYDVSGSRVVPAFPEPGGECVSLYGDSFTWSGEVEHEEAWGNVLAKRLGCRVANFGVGGYGSDQAFLRFRENERDQAPVVVLGHLAENIIRNVNQLRGLLHPRTPRGLKPRFVVDASGALELVPLPSFSLDEYARVVDRPEDHLPHEYFLPDGPSGTLRLRFPFSLSVARAFGNFRVRAELWREPWYAAFYQPDHPAGGLEVTTKILERFDAEARRRGRQPVVLVIPTGLDLAYFAREGAWVYQPLLDALGARGISALNVGPGLMAALGERDPSELIQPLDHFTAEGDVLLANLVYERVRDLVELVEAAPAR